MSHPCDTDVLALLPSGLKEGRLFLLPSPTVDLDIQRPQIHPKSCRNRYNRQIYGKTTKTINRQLA
jgi:hypothetical protein